MGSLELLRESWLPREKLRERPLSEGSSIVPVDGVKNAGRKKSTPRLRLGRRDRDGELGVTGSREK